MSDKSPNSPHSHLYTIADDEAVRTLMDKITQHTDKAPPELLDAFDAAMREYKSTDERERKAFFHGMLTGYSVALQLKQKAA
jgi:hypothetical protein